MLSKSQLKRAGSQRVSVRAQDTVSILRATGNKRISPAEFNALKKYFSVPALQYLGELPTSLIDPLYDAIIDIAPKLHTLGAEPFPWDIDSLTDIYTDPACLSGQGATRLPIIRVSDGEVLRPKGEQILYSSIGSYAAPAVTKAAGIYSNQLFTLSPGNLLIPKRLMYLKAGIRVRGVFYKTDADATITQFRVNIGKSNSAGDDPIWNTQTSAAANSEVPFDVTLRITALGVAGTAKFTTHNNAKLNTSATKTANSSGDVGTQFDTSLDNYISFAVTTTVSGATGIIDYVVSLVP